MRDRRRPLEAVAIYPSDILGYIDRVTMWKRQPLSAPEIAELDRLCRGSLDVRRNGEWVPTKAGRLILVSHPDRTLIQRFQLCQPTPQALHWAATWPDHHVTYVEVSLDWIFATGLEKDEAYEIACEYLVKLHHRDHGIRFYGKDEKSRYTGPRGAPNVLAVYGDKPCRITGEVCCLHLDWRVSGAAALRRAGLDTIGKLVDLDFRAFWSSRLLMSKMRFEYLGRLVTNACTGSNRRGPWMQPWPHGFVFDVHTRTGQIIRRAYGSTQSVIDHCRKTVNVQRCLVPLDVQHLLPPSPMINPDSLTLPASTPSNVTRIRKSMEA